VNGIVDAKVDGALFFVASLFSLRKFGATRKDTRQPQIPCLRFLSSPEEPDLYPAREINASADSSEIGSRKPPSISDRLQSNVTTFREA